MSRLAIDTGQDVMSLMTAALSAPDLFDSLYYTRHPDALTGNRAGAEAVVDRALGR